MFFALLTLGLGLTMLVGVLATVRSGLGNPRKTPRLELPGGDVDTAWAHEIASSTGDACDVRIDYVTRHLGYVDVEWTYISFALPPECPLLLRIRRYEDVAPRTWPIDAFRITGTRFERSAILEGAPLDVARTLLEQPGLVRFLELAPKLGATELRTLRPPSGERRLVLCVGDTLYRTLLKDAVLAAVEIVRGLPAAYREPRIVDGDGPYRGMMADTLELRDRRSAELTEFVAALEDEPTLWPA
ncbi:MAG TPA: hypothetical protein VGM90_15360 [Kofleriaceae bacterium]